MNCPLCIDSTLDVTFHGGIELDICPRCHGVWLDRGELDRLANDDLRSRSPRPEIDGRDTMDHDQRRQEQPREDRGPVEPRRSSGEKSKKKRRKKGLAERLGDVFEEIIDL